MGRPRNDRLLALAMLGAAALVSLPASADPYRFAKGPYLQSVSPQSAVVRFEGSEAASAVVKVSGPGFARDFKSDDKRVFHSIEITGLTPSTTYSYVVSAGDARSAEGKLVTAPSPGGEDRPFSFIVYGDNRTDIAAHQRAVDAISKEAVDFLVNTGDMVGDGSNEGDWRTFFSIEGAMLRDRCVFACVGNHELVGDGAGKFLRYFHPATKGDATTLFYTSRWGSARFFFLNAFASWKDGRDIAWLTEELSRSDGEAGLAHRFVVMHHGPYSSGPHGGNDDFQRTRGLSMLRDHKVTMVFAGHDHLYERGERDGLRYILSGGGGAPLYKARKTPGPATQVVESAHHYVLVRVDGKNVTTTAKRLDGTTMETCQLVEKGYDCSGTLKPVERKPPPSTPPSPPESQPKKACDCSMPGRAAGGPPLGLLAVALVALARRLRNSPKLS